MVDWRMAACTDEYPGLKYMFYKAAVGNTRLVGNFIAM